MLLYSYDEVVAVLRRVEIKFGPLPFDRPEVFIQGRTIRIVVTYRTRDRDTGEPKRVSAPVDMNLPVDDGFLLAGYSKLISSAFYHEFCEAFHLDGIRVHDPHKDESPQAAEIVQVVRAADPAPCDDDCMMCNGEACNLCGAGCWNNSIDRPKCEHDVIERHQHHAV